MRSWLAMLCIFFFQTSALAQNCSGYTFSKNLCEGRLKSLQDYFAPFYHQSSTLRTVGCRDDRDRGNKDSNCVSDKCEAIGFINSCGIEKFSKELLPVMAEGGEDEVIIHAINKHPKIMDQLSPDDQFWNDYFAESRIFFSDVPHLKLKLFLIDKGFRPELPTYKAILEKSLTRRLSISREAESLKKIYEASNFKKEVLQAEKDVAWLNNLKLNGGGNKSISLSGVKIEAMDFERIRENYLNTSRNEADLLSKKIELTSLSLDLKQTPECHPQEIVDAVLRATKKINDQVERYLDYEIDCLGVKEKDDVLSLMKTLNDKGMLTKKLFENLYGRIKKTEPLTDKDILRLSEAVASVDKELGIKLSLLEFEAVHDYALHFNSKECPENSPAYNLLKNLHRKIIYDQTQRFYGKLTDSSVSYAEIIKVTTDKNIDFNLLDKSKKSYLEILADIPKDRFSEKEWNELVDLVAVPDWKVAYEQIGGVNEKYDTEKSAFGLSIKNQNIVLFKRFVEIKKKRPGHKFADERKAALAINRKSGGSETIKDILKDDPYFKKN
ncbi:MAG: hypothetical protein ACOVP4_15095 [Bacteriovoracaceae bacterium]